MDERRSVVAGDVLVEGDTIAAVGPGLAERAELGDRVARAARVDVRGCVVAPGFVDTHRHAWQTQFRRSIADVDDLAGYLETTLAGLAPHYAPEDMYVGTRLAALTALDAGITTMLDFSHNSRSAAHSERAIEALIDTGIRGVHAAMGPHFGEWDRQWPGDLARLVGRYAGAARGLIGFRLGALATDEVAGPDLAYGPRLAAVAADLDVGVSVDAVLGPSSSEAVLGWERAKLLDDRLTLIHCTDLTPEAWRAMGDAGVGVALAPTSDAQIGLATAVPAIDEALAVGLRPGLSIDVEVALASDMFTQMRALHAIQRMRAVAAAHGEGEVAPRLSTADVLDLATARGAAAIGLGDVTGRVVPGLAADLLIVAAEDVNTMPLNDPVATLVLGADARNIRAVLVGGAFMKWNGRLVGVDVDALRRDVLRSRDAINHRMHASR
ncbi:amidohydrolase [Streptomyces radicis]|uniref:Amidohydrolase n=2 Tax=Streptomyces radicis TaxID=1750517 RepID=A0A3A9VSP6_9ACTN|nr:amidohydrolase [Streptomyces radicis]RKN13886.1 amidohydrolase [Streptomyces radicis]